MNQLPYWLAVSMASGAFCVSLLTVWTVVWRGGQMVGTFTATLKEMQSGVRDMKSNLGEMSTLVATTAATLRAVANQVDRVEARVSRLEEGRRHG